MLNNWNMFNITDYLNSTKIFKFEVTWVPKTNIIEVELNY